MDERKQKAHKESPLSPPSPWTLPLPYGVSEEEKRSTNNAYNFLLTCIGLWAVYYFFSHTPGNHVKPTTASLAFIRTITITASQNIQVYMDTHGQ